MKAKSVINIFYAIIFIVLVCIFPKNVIAASFLSNPVKQVYEAQKKILRDVQKSVEQPIKKSSDSAQKALEAKKEADEAAKLVKESTDLNSKVKEQKKEIEALRNAVKEKGSQIEAQEESIQEFQTAIGDFKEETIKTGETAKDYFVVFSGLILSLIGNFISWAKILLTRRKTRLEEECLEIDIKLKNKEYEALNKTFEAEHSASP